MKTTHIPNGFIMLSRQVLESDILFRKPVWFKWWIYIILQASHQERRHQGKTFKRGELLLQPGELENLATYYVGNRPVNKETIHTKHNFIEYLRKQEMITTRKTTRGLIVNVTNYDLYQTASNYELQSENNLEHNGETRQKAIGTQPLSNTINKNEQEQKELKEKRSSGQFSTIKDSLSDYKLPKPYQGQSSEWEYKAEEIAKMLGINLGNLQTRTYASWKTTFSNLQSLNKMGIADAAYSELADTSTAFINMDHKANTFIKIVRDRLNSKN